MENKVEKEVNIPDQENKFDIVFELMREAMSPEVDIRPYNYKRVKQVLKDYMAESLREKYKQMEEKAWDESGKGDSILSLQDAKEILLGKEGKK